MPVPTSFGPGQAGRPKALPKFTVLPFNKNPYHWTTTVEEPDVLKAVSDKYMKSQTLPPGLTARPRLVQNQMNRKISKGWNKPTGAV